MNPISRRRLLLDLAAVGGIVALMAGHELEARPLPHSELKHKLDEAIDKVFAKKEPSPSPTPQPTPPVRQPTPGRLAPPPNYPPAGGMPAPRCPKP